MSYIELMLKGHSLRKCAEILGVRHEQLFYWRHKMLAALKKMESVTPFEGIVEMDENVFRLLREGLPQDGKASQTRWCFQTRHQRSTRLCAGDPGPDETNLQQGDMPWSDLDPPSGRAHCTPDRQAKHPLYRAWRAFKTFASKRGIAHYRFKSTESKRVKGVYLIQNVNNYYSLYKRWLGRFAGVASKYMDNYLAWFQFLQENKELSRQALIRSMFVAACTPSTFETETSLRQARFAA